MVRQRLTFTLTRQGSPNLSIFNARDQVRPQRGRRIGQVAKSKISIWKANAEDAPKVSRAFAAATRLVEYFAFVIQKFFPRAQHARIRLMRPHRNRLKVVDAQNTLWRLVPMARRIGRNRRRPPPPLPPPPPSVRERCQNPTCTTP